MSLWVSGQRPGLRMGCIMSLDPNGADQGFHGDRPERIEHFAEKDLTGPDLIKLEFGRIRFENNGP